jgi:signal transduction histidine kinase/CheY-like chemotaxis protein
MGSEQNKETPLILVADDDRAIRTALKTLLERGKYRVELVANGREAVEAALQLHPDLILMDVKMPLMDGFEAVQRLRDEPTTLRIPVIFLTAAAQTTADAARGITLGADDYLHKPFGVEELLARVERKIRDRQLEERLQQRTLELEALIYIGSQLNDALTIEELADCLLTLVLNQIPSFAASLTLTRPDADLLIYYREQSRPLEIVDQVCSIADLVIQRSEPLILEDRVQLDEIGAEAYIKAAIGVPLVHGGDLLGVLTITDSSPQRYGESELRLMRSIAEQAALALRNTELYARLRDYSASLEAMVEQRTNELLLAQRQLMRAEKLAAIGTLAAGIAHEVNNPLQPILTNLETMLEDLDMGKPILRDDLVHSREQVLRITTLVRRLLNFARPDPQQMGLFSLNETIEDVLALTLKQLSHSAVETIWTPGKVPAIMGNADQLKQVILNLVVNARDAMPEGGTLSLRTAAAPGGALLTIEDTGIGIAPEHLEKIFDAFYTTKANGTGLGLALSHQIIMGHGGSFEVSSTPGHGTQFRIFLPAAN